MLLAREADGSMRDAQSLLEQVLALRRAGGRRQKADTMNDLVAGNSRLGRA